MYIETYYTNCLLWTVCAAGSSRHDHRVSVVGECGKSSVRGEMGGTEVVSVEMRCCPSDSV